MMENQDFMDFVNEQGGLNTGSFSFWRNIAEKLKLKVPEPGSHRLMNLDDNESFNGAKPFNKIMTKHEAARIAAEKEINKLVDEHILQ